MFPENDWQVSRLTEEIRVNAEPAAEGWGAKGQVYRTRYMTVVAPSTELYTGV